MQQKLLSANTTVFPFYYMNQAFFVSSLWSHFVPRGKDSYSFCCSCRGLVARSQGLCSPATAKKGRTSLELNPLPLPMLLVD